MEVVRNTFYPRVAKTKNMLLVRKITIVMTLFAIMSVICINIFATQIIMLFGGQEMIPSLGVVRLFSIIIIADHIQHYYMTIGLWSLGYSWLFRNLMIVSLCIYVLLYMAVWLLGFFSVYMATIIPILVDVYLIIHIFWFWNKNKLNGKYSIS
jgi:PST family polysaccharide transporter